jgi:lipid-binding SYLF domain-containing protein
MKAEIYAYSMSKGLFIGISVKGAVIHIDADANEKFYRDPEISARRIFTQLGLEGPPVADRLRKVLAKFLSSGYRV